MGFIFLDGETATANGDGLSFVTIDGLHTECNQDPDTTYSAGVRPYDKAGMIRLGVKPSLSTKQHDLQIRGWHHSFPGGIKSHSSVHITASSGSSVDAADKVSLNIRMAHTLSSTDTGDAGTTNEVRVLAGLVPSERMWPWVGCGNVAEYDPSVGPDNTSNGVRSFVYRRDGAEAHRSIGGIARTVSQLDAFPIGPCGPVLCTDCTTTTLGITPVGGGSHKMLVFYNGANWRTIAVAN
jgi:hypothetical protein